MTQYAPASMAPKDYETIFKGALAEQKQAAGPDIYEDVQRKLSGLETDRGENLEKAKGLAALQAAAAMAQGSNFTRGLAGAASAFGSSYGKALEADAEQKRALISAQFQMADAKRKEAIGMHKEARASADAARTAFKDAQKLELDKRKYAVDALVRGAAATQTTTRPAPTGGSGAAALKQQAFASFYNMFKNQFPNETHDQITTRAYGAVAQLGAGNIPADITRQKLVENSVTKEKTENPTQWNARVQKFMGMGSNFSAAQEQAAQEVRAQAEAVYPSSVFTPYSPSEPPRISKDSSGLSTLPPGFKPRK
jgi:hypothetical protein